MPAPVYSRDLWQQSTDSHPTTHTAWSSHRSDLPHRMLLSDPPHWPAFLLSIAEHNFLFLPLSPSRYSQTHIHSDLLPVLFLFPFPDSLFLHYSPPQPPLALPFLFVNHLRDLQLPVQLAFHFFHLILNHLVSRQLPALPPSHLLSHSSVHPVISFPTPQALHSPNQVTHMFLPHTAGLLRSTRPALHSDHQMYISHKLPLHPEV